MKQLKLTALLIAILFSMALILCFVDALTTEEIITVPMEIAELAPAQPLQNEASTEWNLTTCPNCLIPDLPMLKLASKPC